MSFTTSNMNAVHTQAQLHAELERVGLGLNVSQTDVGRAGVLISTEIDPKSADDVRAAVQLIERFAKPGEPLVFEGYTDVSCADARTFTWECMTHFLEEGVSKLEAEAFRASYARLFAECFDRVPA